MRLSPSVLALLWAVECSAAWGPSILVHETAAAVPSEWTYIGPASTSRTLTLSIALKQGRIEELRRRVDAISDPSHEDYGAHLSRDELRSYRLAGRDAATSVVDWLAEHDIRQYQVDESWILFNATVGALNELLATTLVKYRNEKGKPVYRAKEYSLPQGMSSYIDFIYPVSQYIRTPARRHSPLSDAEASSRTDIRKRQTDYPPTCWDAVVPDCLRDLYNLTYIPPTSPGPGVALAVAGFLEQYPSQSDLRAFLSRYSTRRNETGFFPENYTYTVESINGGSARDANVSNVGLEAMLDMEYTMPFVHPLPVTYYSTGGRGPEVDINGQVLGPQESGNEPWIEFLETLLAKGDVELPRVLSISYSDDEQAVPRPYAQRVCDLFTQLAGRGVSVLIATGDGGAGGIGATDCYLNDGNNNNTRFLPTFPASCPYVTSVGGVSNFLPLTAATYSSGGFSNYFDRPSWQKTSAEAYLEAIGPEAHKGWYNASGRGMPDVAAVGSRFQVFVGGGLFFRPRSGTSASTPVWATMITLANDMRMRAGKAPLGFLNPLLYSEKVKKALQDVTEGSSGSCTYGDQVELGWDAKAGWDPATGWGVPRDFWELMEALV